MAKKKNHKRPRARCKSEDVHNKNLFCNIIYDSITQVMLHIKVLTKRKRASNSTSYEIINHFSHYYKMDLLNFNIVYNIQQSHQCKRFVMRLFTVIFHWKWKGNEIEIHLKLSL